MRSQLALGERADGAGEGSSLRDGADGDWAEEDDFLVVLIVVVIAVVVATRLRRVAACGWVGGVVEVDADV